MKDELIIRQAVLDLWEGYMPFIATKACEYDTKLRKLPSEPVGNSDTAVIPAPPEANEFKAEVYKVINGM